MSSSTSNSIDEKTKVPLGLTIGIVSTIVAALIGAGSFVWWAGRWTSKMEEKMDNITTLLQSYNAMAKTHDAALEELKTRMSKIETIGSPQVMLIQKDIAEVRRMIELHMASDKKTP